MILPLKLPPGISRPGTKYDARGRWYDSSLVRWHEGTMQPIGGWQPLTRTAAVSVSAAISDDGGAFTDETTDANDAGADDVVLVPASPVNNDAFYLGYAYRFTEVQVNTSTVATDGTVTWEYWNGTAWTALTSVSDDTSSFKTSGLKSVTWALPWNWAKNTVNSQGPYYYVRARVSSAGTSTALGQQCFIGVGPVDVDEVIRGLYAWRPLDGVPHLFIGTPTKAFIAAGGTLTDITPAGFTTGAADAALASGNYGAGAYGAGPYGTGDAAQANVVEANTWQHDNFGEDLVFWAFSDKKLYLWDKSVGGVGAAVTNAPTSNAGGLVVTPERMVVALGAGGDDRKVQWCDRENITVWTNLPENTAGDQILATKGRILTARVAKNETIIWTDIDLWAMRFIGGQFVYGFHKVGSQCGPMSRRSMAIVDGLAIWMGQGHFFAYTGVVEAIPSDVSDYVFADMNTLQVSKITADVRSQFNEIIWYYPSSASTENDRYVVFNYREQTWAAGLLQRTSGVDRDAFLTPLASDAGGVVYQHETGTSYLDHTGTALTPYAESGPIEIAQGERLMQVNEYIPDEKTLGDTRAYLYSSMYPTAAETQSGPFTTANPTIMRISGRLIRLRVEQVATRWRVGTPSLDLVPGERR